MMLSFCKAAFFAGRHALPVVLEKTGDVEPFRVFRAVWPHIA
jgi:hypothetical protein